MDKSHKIDVNFPFLVLTSIFVAGAVVTNIIGVKIMTFIGLNFTAGMLAYCVTFPITDTVGEIWGKKAAQQVVWTGLIGNIVMVALVQIAVRSSPAPFWGFQEEYAQTLGFVPRIVFASMTAFLISQLHDVWAFHFWRHITKQRFLWLRNNLSTMTSQLIDSLLFVTIAFAGLLSWPNLISVFFGQYIIKLLIAMVDTPVVYLLVGLLRKGTSARETAHTSVRPKPGP